MKTMYDAADGSAHFPSEPPVDAVAGYVNGNYRSYPGLVATYPDALHLPISVTASALAKCLDVESGDANPGEVPAWVEWARRAGDPFPWVYMAASNWPECKLRCHLANVAEPLWWVASWNGDANIPPGAVAHQYASLTTYDLSVFADVVPGFTGPAPTPGPTIRKDATMYLVESKQSGKGWKIVPDAHQPIIQLPGEQFRELQYAGFPYIAFATDLEVVREVVDALRMQGRPASDIQEVMAAA